MIHQGDFRGSAFTVGRVRVRLTWRLVLLLYSLAFYKFCSIALVVCVRWYSFQLYVWLVEILSLVNAISWLPFSHMTSMEQDLDPAGLFVLHVRQVS